MSQYRSEADERTVRRFEAFSDIVIGFSLAQLGVTLVMPARGADLFANPVWLISFFWTFSVICAMWWFHHRIFASVFSPRTLPVLLNFMWLAVVVLCVFAMQIMYRRTDDPTGWRFSFALFALAYGLLSAQYYVALAERAGALPAEMRAAAQRQASFMVLWTATFAVAAVMLFILPWGPQAEFSTWIPIGVAVTVNILLARRYRRLLEAQATASAQAESASIR